MENIWIQMCFISIIHVFQVYNIKHAPHVYNNLKKIEYIKNIKFDSILKNEILFVSIYEFHC